jgi:hypothetical protein
MSTDVVSVDFSATLGAPTYRASGILYGITEDGSDPPDHFFTDVKFRFQRAGGSQLDSPGGWVAGTYDRRFNATLAQYKRTVALGGMFIILPQDIWGADGSSIPTFPGDDGHWSQFDDFLNRLVSDAQANAMNPQWDIWNEPDLESFWDRSQAQYLEMWRRAYRRIRATFPDAVIVGPSTARQPTPDNSWWATYLDYVEAHNVAPDIVSWHSLSTSIDPAVSKEHVDQLLSTRGWAPTPYQINEYGATCEQTPGRSAWYIARLERAGIDGLRANWASGAGLHDNMAALLTKSGTQYWPRGDWFVYQSYASMSGVGVHVTHGANIDGYATKDTNLARAAALLGNHGATGIVKANLNRLDTTGLVQNGKIRVVVERVPNADVDAGRVTVSDQTIMVRDNTAAALVSWTNADDAYALTLLPPAVG